MREQLTFRFFSQPFAAARQAGDGWRLPRQARRPYSLPPMPIHLEIFHPDRIAICVARGEITLAEFGDFVRDLAQAGVLHYRKIFDVTEAKSSTIGTDELLAADQRLRAVIGK